MTEPILYSDSDLMIDYLRDCKGNISSKEEYEILIGKEGEYYRTILPRGILRELAKTPRNKLERKLNRIDDELLNNLEEVGLSFESLGIAICQAYIEEEERAKENDYIESDIPL